MPRKLCRRCGFMEEIEGDTYCYRYPPKLVVIDKIRSTHTRTTRQQIRSEYPVVDKDVDWCGEFEKREEEDDIIDAS